MPRLYAYCLLACFPTLVHGQTLIEYSLGTAGAAAAAAGKGIEKSLSSVLTKVGKGIDNAAKSGTKETPSATVSQPKPPTRIAARGAQASEAADKLKSTAGEGDAAKSPDPPKPMSYEEPDGITAGLEREELIRRFGEPSMKTAKSEEGYAVETYWYPSKNRPSIVVTLKNVKVTAVASEQPQQSGAVVLLQ